MFKVSLAAFPVTVVSLITWGAWVTMHIAKHDEQLKAPRYTLNDAVQREAVLRTEHQKALDEMEQRIERHQREILAAVKGPR